MPRLTWDGSGEKIYETGVRNGVLYKPDSTGKYVGGVPWNGLTAVNESPSGAEETELYADDIKYAGMRSAEKYGATIECYTYPDEFDECNGAISLLPGVKIGQQRRKPFGFCYRTGLGNDTEGDDYGYILHLIYGATASPSEKNHETINDSPNAATLSYELTTTPVPVKINDTEYRPSATIELDSTVLGDEKMRIIEDILYGTASTEARMPLPDEIYDILHTPSSEKKITTFKINNVDGTINESSHTVDVTLPTGTDVTALEPVITVSTGATVVPASGVSTDFTSPVTYTVTAEDETTQAYTVTVTLADSVKKMVRSTNLK